MADAPQTDSKEPDRGQFYLILGVWLSIGVVLALVLGGVVLWFAFPKQDLRGQFGDQFGVVTALFTGLAFAWFIVTVFMQRRELQLQREELKQATSAHLLQADLMRSSQRERSVMDIAERFGDRWQSVCDNPEIDIRDLSYGTFTQAVGHRLTEGQLGTAWMETWRNHWKIPLASSELVNLRQLFQALLVVVEHWTDRHVALPLDGHGAVTDASNVLRDDPGYVFEFVASVLPSDGLTIVAFDYLTFGITQEEGTVSRRLYAPARLEIILRTLSLVQRGEHLGCIHDLVAHWAGRMASR